MVSGPSLVKSISNINMMTKRIRFAVVVAGVFLLSNLASAQARWSE